MFEDESKGSTNTMKILPVEWMIWKYKIVIVKYDE